MMTTPEMDKPRLLLVDDDETFCSVLRSALERRNYEVLVGTNVTEGIALAEQNLPEYAVIDLRIGYESGLELVKKLISLDDNTQIVMLTGFASIATAVEAIKLGATHYLTKPANADEIVSALNKKAFFKTGASHLVLDTFWSSSRVKNSLFDSASLMPSTLRDGLSLIIPSLTACFNAAFTLLK